jgi:translocation and assembly module TamB
LLGQFAYKNSQPATGTGRFQHQLACDFAGPRHICCTPRFPTIANIRFRLSNSRGSLNLSYAFFSDARALLQRWRFVVVSAASLAALFLAVTVGLPFVASTQLIPGIAKQYGGRVEAGHAHAGWKKVTLDRLRIFEADGEHILAEIGHLELDLTLWDLVRGRTTPHHVSVVAPHITLRFDDAGRLLSEIPPAKASGDLPQRIEVADGAITIEQQTRRATFDGAAAQAALEDGEYVIGGSVASSKWGHWKFQGAAEPTFTDATLTAETTDLPLTPDALAGLPLVPPTIASQISTTATIAAQIALRLHPPSGMPMIHANLQTAHAEISFPAAGIHVSDVSLEATLNDTLAELKTARGALGGGEASITGQIDFGREPVQSSLNVHLVSVDAAEVAEKWPLPKDTDGRLNASANLKVSVESDGALKVGGQGEATISNAKIAGVPIQPIAIQVQGGNQPGQPDARREDNPASGEITTRLELRDAPLAKLLEFLGVAGVELGDVEGRVTTDVSVRIPLATITDVATYRMHGSVKSPRLAVHGIALENIDAPIDLAGGTLRVKPLAAMMPGEEYEQPGKITGSLEAQLAPRRDVAVQLTIDELPLSLSSKTSNLSDQPSGAAKLSLDASAPIEKVTDSSSWKASGRLVAPQIRVQRQTIENVTADIGVENGSLNVGNAAASLAHTQVTGSAKLRLADAFSFTATFNLQEASLAKLASLAPGSLPEPLSGQVTASGSAEGSLNPFRWTSTGEMAATALRAGPLTVDTVTAKFSGDRDELELASLQASAFGGQITGTGRLPLSQNEPSQLSGQFSNVHLERVVSELLGSTVNTTGNVSGQFSFSGDRLDQLDGQVELHSAQAGASGVAVSEVRGAVDVKRGAVQYDLSANVFGGKLTASGDGQFSQSASAPMTGQGRLSLKEIDLNRLATELQPRQNLPIEGNVDLALDYRQTADDLAPTGAGRLTVRNLRWNRRQVSPLIQGDVTLAHWLLRLPQLSGDLAGGTFVGSLTVSLVPDQSGEFKVSFRGMSAAELLAPWPDLARETQASLHGYLRGTIGRQIAGGGSIGSSRARIAGLEINAMRVPVQFVFSTASQRGELRVHESSAGVAHGRITGSATFVQDQVLSFNAKTRLTNLELGALTASAGNLGLSTGRISGRADFSANNLRSLNDIDGSYDLSLADAQARQMPVLSNLSQYVLPLNASTGNFNQGELRGTLVGGVARIRRFTLTGNDTRLMADGAVAASGRIDLNLVAQTGGQPLSRGLVRRVVLPIVEAEVVPYALLTRANQVLADQVVYLRIGGTIRSPSVQVQPGPQLSYEAIRFFAVGTLSPLP